MIASKERSAPNNTSAVGVVQREVQNDMNTAEGKEEHFFNPYIKEKIFINSCEIQK